MIKWRYDDRQYTSGELGFIGRHVAFEAFYDGTTDKNDPAKYRLACRLFGLKPTIGHFETLEQAKSKADEVLTSWLSRTGLSIKEKGDE